MAVLVNMGGKDSSSFSMIFWIRASPPLGTSRVFMSLLIAPHSAHARPIRENFSQTFQVIFYNQLKSMEKITPSHVTETPLD